MQPRVPPLAMHAHEQRRSSCRCLQPRAAAAAAGARPPFCSTLLCPQLHTGLGMWATARPGSSAFLHTAFPHTKQIAAFCCTMSTNSDMWMRPLVLEPKPARCKPAARSRWAASQCNRAGTHLQHVLRLLLHKGAQLCIIHLQVRLTPSGAFTEACAATAQDRERSTGQCQSSWQPALSTSSPAARRRAGRAAVSGRLSFAPQAPAPGPPRARWRGSSPPPRSRVAWRARPPTCADEWRGSYPPPCEHAGAKGGNRRSRSQATQVRLSCDLWWQ